MLTPPLETLNVFQLEDAFLAWLDEWHANHAYELDYRVIAQTLQVPVRYGRSSCYDPFYHRVHLNADVHFVRERHESLHEFGHLLFHRAEGGAFAAALGRLTNTEESATKVEEAIVRRAGVRLATPEVYLRQCAANHDTLTACTVALAKRCSVSFGLAVRRVMAAQTQAMRGVIIDSSGTVVDGFGYGRRMEEKHYPRPGNSLPVAHELRALGVSGKTVRLRCAIPFKTGGRHEVWDTEAIHDQARGQTLALFYKFKAEKATMPRLL